MLSRPAVWLAAAIAAVALSAVAAPARKPAKPPPSTAPAAGDWRTPDPQDVLVIDTNKGRIIVELAPRIAPLTTARIRDLARQKFYDGQSFFRVIDEFMDQTGDPQNTGVGGSTLPNLPPEFTFRRGSDLPFTLVDAYGGEESGFIGPMPVVSQPLALAALIADSRVNAYGTFCPGVAGMARADAPGSGNSQFFLMRGARRELDRKYTPFGRVIAGEDVVRAIKTGEPPEPPADKMLTVRVLADLPAASRPRVRVIETASPWFAAFLARYRLEHDGSVTICDLELPSDVTDPK
jgi:peptidylprolyl isomerase